MANQKGALAPVRLDSLRPGETFSLVGEHVSGEVVRIGAGSVTVKLKGAPRDVAFVAPDGATRTFKAAETTVTTWSRGTMVRGRAAPPQALVPNRESRQ